MPVECSAFSEKSVSADPSRLLWFVGVEPVLFSACLTRLHSNSFPYLHTRGLCWPRIELQPMDEPGSRGLPGAVKDLVVSVSSCFEYERQALH